MRRAVAARGGMAVEEGRAAASGLTPRAGVLLVEPDPGPAGAMRQALQDEGYEVSLAVDAASALRMTQQRVFDLAILGVPGPDRGDVPGLLASLIATDPTLGVLLAVSPGTVDTALRCMRRGAWGYIMRPVRLDELKIQLERMLDHHELRASVQLYESTHPLLTSLSTAELRGEVLGMARRVLRSPTSVLLLHPPGGEGTWDLQVEGPDGSDAVALVQHLFIDGNRLPSLPWSGRAAERPETAGLAPARIFDRVLAYPLLARDRCLGLLVTLRRAGNSAYTRMEERRGRQFAQQSALALDNARIYAALESVAVIDELTGLHSRRYLFDIVRRSGPEAVTVEGTSFLMVDVDHFKQVNDTHGHAVGDRVLRKVAELLVAATRDSDVVARVGGEEFAVLLPHTEEETATDVAERVRAMIALHTEDPQVTVSVGVASLAGALFVEGEDPLERASTLMERADVALYRAKRAGRNRVCVWRARRREALAPADR